VDPKGFYGASAAAILKALALSSLPWASCRIGKLVLILGWTIPNQASWLIIQQELSSPYRYRASLIIPVFAFLSKL